MTASAELLVWLRKHVWWSSLCISWKNVAKKKVSSCLIFQR